MAVLARRERRPAPLTSRVPTPAGRLRLPSRTWRRSYLGSPDAAILADDGRCTIENAYVRDLIDHTEFDTVYHEHYCYFSTVAIDALTRRHGLHLTRVEHFPQLHGGRLRWTVRRQDRPEPSVQAFLDEEWRRGVDTAAFYQRFGERVVALQQDLLDLLYRLRLEEHEIAAYGAAAKGATLLNATRVPRGLLSYVVDRNVHKQGRYMAGTHLEIRDPEVLLHDPPAYLLVLAWNLLPEIRRQLADYEAAGGRFIVPVPKPRVLD